MVPSLAGSRLRLVRPLVPFSWVFGNDSERPQFAALRGQGRLSQAKVPWAKRGSVGDFVPWPGAS